MDTGPAKRDESEEAVPSPMHESVVFADAAGTMRAYPNTSDFWTSIVGGLPEGYLISEFTFTESWPNWERHPKGDEFVFVLSGNITLIFEKDSGDQHNPLGPGQFTFIPRNNWHTADLSEPVRALFITFGKGTENKPRSPS
ncbi:MAG: cupin domain-containing protein [Pseudomonadota bacterium]